MSVSEKRNLYIDIAKGIGIIVVVFAHNMHLYSVRAHLFPFAVHFFFFMAGYNFNLSKYSREPLRFVRTRVLRLMLPYLAACICSYLFYEVTAPMLSLPPINAASAWDGIMSGYLPDLEFNIVLWFLPALFFVDMIFLALGYKLKGVYFFAAIMLVTAAGFVLGKYDQQIILSFDIAMTVQFFVYSGYMLRQSNLLEKTMQAAGESFLKFISTTSFFLLLIAVIVYNANQIVPDIPTRAYGNPFLFFSAGLSGSIVVLMTSFFIATLFHRYIGRTLALIGRASLDILIAHIPIFLFFASVCAMFGGLWIHDTYRNYWYLIFLAGIAVPTLSHSCIAFILNKTIKPQNLLY